MKRRVSSELFEQSPVIEVDIDGLVAKTKSAEYSFEIESDYQNILSTTVNGKPYKFVVTLDENAHPVVSYCGYLYPLRALTDTEFRYQSILKAQAVNQGGTAKCAAPMPGLIKNVYVKNGQLTKKGDTIFVLEAMKMENAIKAPLSGTVQKLSVKNGEAVDKGALLCMIESSPEAAK